MRIAITGGIGEGKSTVLDAIRDLGYPVASSDVIARQVFELEETQASIRAALGVVDREALRTLIASDADARRRLNRIVHPLVVQALQSSDAQFFEVPLLVEACLLGLFDRVWVVTCGREEQLARLRARYGSEDVAEALIRTQLPTEAKIPFADEVIRTNASRERVTAVVKELVAMVRDSRLRAYRDRAILPTTCLPTVNQRQDGDEAERLEGC